MTDLPQLVRDAAAFAGAQPPPLLSGDAPVPEQAVLADQPDQGFYLIGLIGGKEVGKSSLVNALVGQPITTASSHGRGTDAAIAYAHSSQEGALRQLLDRQAPGRHRIVTHELPHLVRQVLLDLPDIDSQYSDHLELTRRMLRHMLFPIWIQSIEKYADQQPQALLNAVAQGNDPSNFIFCLNKADQLTKADASGIGLEEELRNDFSIRIARTLDLASPPRVFLTSAIEPDRFDLPVLREALAHEKSSTDLTSSRQAAARQQARSLLAWLDNLRLPQQLQRLRDLEEEAGELVRQRLGVPLLEQTLPALAEHPANRLALADEVLAARVSRWPIVNVLHVLLWPVTSVWRRNVTVPDPAALGGQEGLVESHLQMGRPLAQTLQATFAQLEQAHTGMAELYRHQPLWEPMAAEQSAADLRRRLVDTLHHQRTTVRSRLMRPASFIGDIVRGVLTLGAVLWFPLLQPMVEAMLLGSTMALPLLLVQLLSVSHLLQNAVFLILYFAFIWMVLKWDSQRRVQRLLMSSQDAESGLHGQALEWIDELLSPIHQRRQALEDLLDRIDQARESLKAPKLGNAA